MNKRVMELKSVEVWDGNMANSQAFRQADVDVVAAYPITPSTATVENYAMFHANGYVDGEVMMTESEHAAMSACVGAAAAGGRVPHPCDVHQGAEGEGRSRRGRSSGRRRGYGH